MGLVEQLLSLYSEREQRVIFSMDVRKAFVRKRGHMPLCDEELIRFYRFVYSLRMKEKKDADVGTGDRQG